MSGVDRPSFSESWHRVRGSRPRLRAGARVVGQTHRGRRWFVVQDPTAGQYFRLSEPAYRLVALLDGRRTVAQAWSQLEGVMGEAAPTQAEVVQVLGQLHDGNLLTGEPGADAQAQDRRARRRARRELRGRLANLLFLRVPLVDPDAWLGRWAPLVAWLFGPPGAALFAASLAAGAFHLAGRERQLVSGASGVLSPDNLPLLYAAFVAVKAVHELAHAFACKVLGAREGGAGAGAVHTLGMMLMVLVPAPYVDASSSWALRSKRARITVAAAGVLAEFVVAGAAAVLWARTTDGSVANAIAFNVLLVASVSTFVVNGNPLMKYDGYFILQDLLEIPNLATRSVEYLRYLVKKRVWGVRRLVDPSSGVGERAWLLTYAPASLAYRAVVLGSIVLYVSKEWPSVGLVIAAYAILVWASAPCVSFARYLWSSPELARVRARAVGSTLAAAAVAVVLVGAVRLPERVRALGVVEAAEPAILRARAPGFVAWVRPSGETVRPGDLLVRVESGAILARRRALEERLAELRIEHRRALADEPALRLQRERELEAVGDQLQVVLEELAGLRIVSPRAGRWVAPDTARTIGGFVERGQALGQVFDPADLWIRIAVPQIDAARLSASPPATADIRPRLRPEQAVAAVVRSVVPAGQRELPSQALRLEVGGTLAADRHDDRAARTAEPFLEVRLAPSTCDGLFAGQRVEARFTIARTPLAVQAAGWVSRLLQERFALR